MSYRHSPHGQRARRGRYRPLHTVEVITFYFIEYLMLLSLHHDDLNKYEVLPLLIYVVLTVIFITGFGEPSSCRCRSS